MKGAVGSAICMVLTDASGAELNRSYLIRWLDVLSMWLMQAGCEERSSGEEAIIAGDGVGPVMVGCERIQVS